MKKGCNNKLRNNLVGVCIQVLLQCSTVDLSGDVIMIVDTNIIVLLTNWLILGGYFQKTNNSY
jgi:hypothetical protein